MATSSHLTATSSITRVELYTFYRAESPPCIKLLVNRGPRGLKVTLCIYSMVLLKSGDIHNIHVYEKDVMGSRRRTCKMYRFIQ